MSSVPNAPAAVLLLLADADNCLIACRDLAAGSVVLIDDAPCTLHEAVAMGHKLARRDIAAGEKIVRWGAPIGSATRAIARGAWIHTANLASDYLPTYLAEGDASYVHRHA